VRNTLKKIPIFSTQIQGLEWLATLHGWSPKAFSEILPLHATGLLLSQGCPPEIPQRFSILRFQPSDSARSVSNVRIFSRKVLKVCMNPSWISPIFFNLIFNVCRFRGLRSEVHFWPEPILAFRALEKSNTKFRQRSILVQLFKRHRPAFGCSGHFGSTIRAINQAENTLHLHRRI
jgi:hypothetical protein